ASSKVLECWDMLKLEYVAIKIFTNLEDSADYGRDEIQLLQYLGNLYRTGSCCVQMRNSFEHSNHLFIVLVELEDLPKSKVIKLIDFGCSILNSSNVLYEYDCGTDPFWAPECLFGGQLFPGRDFFFYLAVMQRLLGPIPEYMLDNYVLVTGMKDFKQTLAHWAEEAPRDMSDCTFMFYYLPQDLVVESANDPVRNDYLMLLQGLLKYEPSERLTAQEALAHPFFTMDWDTEV
ncbi:hypothetical protein IFM89_010610, partial [Coptis chinensis]